MAWKEMLSWRGCGRPHTTVTMRAWLSNERSKSSTVYFVRSSHTKGDECIRGCPMNDQLSVTVCFVFAGWVVGWLFRVVLKC